MVESPLEMVCRCSLYESGEVSRTGISSYMVVSPLFYSMGEMVVLRVLQAEAVSPIYRQEVLL